MKSYTDLEQSKKLAEILPFESADMYYCYGMDIHTKGWSFDDTPTIIDNSNRIDVHADIPCWSLAALMDVLDRGALFITPQGWACQSYINFKAITSDHHSNPIDACYEIILRLHELKML